MPLRRSKRKAAEANKTVLKKSRGAPRVATKGSEPKPSIQEPDDAHSANSMWLDALPQDICCRIAAYITHDRDAYRPEFLNEDALELAQTSPKQMNVMAEALDHTPKLRYKDVKSWLEVFKHPVHIDTRGGRGNAVLELLSRHSLRSALIVNREDQLNAFTTGHSVTDLSIYIEQLTYERFDSMLDALKKLTQLVSLAILCDSGRTCGFEYTVYGHQAYQRLADACPRLTALHMRCQCDFTVDHSPIVDAFPSLKEITVSRPLADAALPYMRSRESVILQPYRKPLCCYASEIGAAVTGIKFAVPNWTHFDPQEKPRRVKEVNAEEVAMLKNCPRLRELELLLRPGAEEALPETKLLVSLQLYWSFKNRHFEEKEKTWLGIPLDGSLVRRTFAQPLLEKLTLVGACIRMDDLEAVLRATGKSLKMLTVSSTGQPESILDRSLGILEKVNLHNDNVREMRIVEPVWINWFHPEKFLSKEPVEKQKEFPARFRERVRKLQRKNPWFDPTVLLGSVYWIVSYCATL